jgi:vancomycin resistance protein YoaR
VVGVLAALYLVDLLTGMGRIPRATTVASVQVGGMSYEEAEQRLRTELEPRQSEPVPVQAAEVTTTIDPKAAGLSVDWPATLDRAKAQPFNPITRLRAFFVDREVGVASVSDEEKLAGVLQALQPVVDRPVAEGNVRFEGLQPIPVDPVPGRALDLPAAGRLLLTDWLNGATIQLPMNPLAPSTTPEAVRAAIEQVALPAVSAPVILAGEGKQATITRETIAAALTFLAEGPNLRPQLQSKVVADAVRPALASTEKPGRDATIAIVGGRPVVTPSVDGRGIDFDKTLAAAPEVITRPADRRLVAVYGDQPAKVTTEDINKLGITAVISEFTTRGFAPDSGVNIRTAAAAINGSILQPGETFSLNGATGNRSAATGYIEAGIIEDGHPSRGVGGGVSQVATTLYNAAYFAGMTDVEHREHSFYISRYPVAREATVVQGALDVKFRNDNPTGVYIQTVWTPSSITIRMFGTKRYEVGSATGPRTNPTTPNEVVIPAGQPCTPSEGSGGFTATDTRTLRDVNTGKTRSETRTVVYKPAPKVVCEPPPS